MFKWFKDEEGEKALSELQESFGKLVKFHRELTNLIIELDELQDPRIRGLFDKYEVTITYPVQCP